MTGRARLYVIVGPDAPLGAVATATLCARHGVADVQLRDKGRSDGLRLALAGDVATALRPTATRLWVNDRVDLAVLVGADGVHLGQSDVPPRVARALVAPGCLLGRSTHSTEQVREADGDDAVDWIAIGPVFATSSKANPEPTVGLAGVTAARRATTKPLLAIGGLGCDNVAQVLAAGADRVVVLSAVAQALTPAALEDTLGMLAATCGASA